MAFISTVDDNNYRIEPGETTHQREVSINGTPHTIDWQQVLHLAGDAKGPISGGRFSLIIAGRSYEVFVRRVIKPEEGDSQNFEVLFDGRHYDVQVEDEREKALANSVGGHVSGEAKLRAPMPGLVIGVPHEVGTSVTKGQTVIVLEAMKMENDLAAPHSGVIKEIRFTKGQTVNQGDILVVIVSE